MALSNTEKELLSTQVREKTLFEPVLTPEYLRHLEAVEIEDTEIETREGQTHVFIIRSRSRQPGCPVYVYFHGGGFVRPHGTRNIAFGAMVANTINGICLDVDYRLAPEYPYPVAFHEAYDTVKWVFDHAGQLGIDPTRVIVGGDSAGGNLTAAVAIRAGETGDFRLRMQMLFYPVVDSVTQPGDKPEAALSAIPVDRLRAFNRLYLNDDEAAARSPYVSMLFAPDALLQDLPEMLLITAGKDNLRFEADQYAARLASFGVPVTSHCCPESRHSFVINCIDEWIEAHQLIVQTLLRVVQPA